MGAFSETRQVNHPPALLYRVVSDIAAYPLFLPWCKSAEQVPPPAGSCSRPCHRRIFFLATARWLGCVSWLLCQSSDCPGRPPRRRRDHRPSSGRSFATTGLHLEDCRARNHQQQRRNQPCGIFRHLFVSRLADGTRRRSRFFCSRGTFSPSLRPPCRTTTAG